MSDRILSLEDIMAARDVETRVVRVPEWGGAVRIQTITKARQQQIRKLAAAPDGQVDPDKMEVLLLAACLAEPAVTTEQAEVLREKSAAAVDRVLRAILELNGMTPEAQREAVKSFLPGPDGA